MTDRYARIRDALAMGPTPGPWGLKELPRDMQRDGYKFSISRGGLGWWIAKITHEANGGSGVANATYIAACDPDTIRALLEERDQLAAALAHRVHPAITFCDNCGCDWLDNGLNPVNCPYCTIRELMEALRKVLPVLEFEVERRGSADLLYKTPAGPVLDAARAAIAKAEGRSDE